MVDVSQWEVTWRYLVNGKIVVPLEGPDKDGAVMIDWLRVHALEVARVQIQYRVGSDGPWTDAATPANLGSTGL